MINTLLAKVNIPGWKKIKANYNFSGFAFMLLMSQFVCETWAKNPIRSRNALVECWAIANLSGRD